MATFRSNHAGRNYGGSKRKKPVFLLKVVVYSIVLLFFLWKLLLYFQRYEGQNSNSLSGLPPQSIPEASIHVKGHSNGYGNLSIDLPSQTKKSALIQHSHFTLSYSEADEQAEWVSYELTRAELNAPKVERFNYFTPDHSVLTRSALHRDYTGSGFTRGHLAPAADMAFDRKAAEECFFMSNISPQDKFFNQGIWRELEENVRDWARTNHSLLVVTGPVLNQGIIKKIGDNRVSVPSLFYKVLLDTTGTDKKGIGFIIPNKKSELPLEDHMVTIDSVEALTKIDFYNSKSKNSFVESLESSISNSAWPVNSNRYKKRIEEWNRK